MESQDRALRIANAYQSFISSVKSAQDFLKKVSELSPILLSGFEQLSKLRQSLDMKALYFLSVISKNEECATAIADSALITHFVTDCKEQILTNASAAFLSSVLAYNILLQDSDVSSLLRSKPEILSLVVDLIKSPKVTMEALSVSVKAIKKLVDILPVSLKESLLDIVPTLNAFATSPAPQTLKHEMLVGELWEIIPGIQETLLTRKQ